MRNTKEKGEGEGRKKRDGRSREGLKKVGREKRRMEFKAPDNSMCKGFLKTTLKKQLGKPNKIMKPGHVT